MLTDFIWTVLRCYLELDVEVATGNTLGLEMFVFREKNICSAEKKNRPKFFSKMFLKQKYEFTPSIPHVCGPLRAILKIV